MNSLKVFSLSSLHTLTCTDTCFQKELLQLEYREWKKENEGKRQGTDLEKLTMSCHPLISE